MPLGRIFLVRAWKTHAEAQRRNVTDQFVMGWPSIKDTSPLGQCNVFLGTLIHTHGYTRSTRRDATRRYATRRYAMCTHMQTHDGIRCNMCMHAVRLCVRARCVRACSPVARLSKYNPTTMYTRIWDVFNGYRDFRYSPTKSENIYKSDEGAVESRMQESIFRIRSVYPRYISRARIFSFV